MIRLARLHGPFAWQREVLDDGHRFKCVFCGRRGGKSDLALMAALVGHGPNRKFKGAICGGAVCWALPTWPLATDAWDRLCAATRDVCIDKSEVLRRVRFPGGGSVVVKSTDNPDGLRGPGYDLVLVDEVKDHGPDVWDALRPTLTDRRGSAILVGTPGHLGGWSHQHAEHVRGDPSWRVWVFPTAASPLIHPDEIEAARRHLGSTVFAREYLAQHISQSGGSFKWEWFKFYSSEGQDFRLGDRLVAADRLRKFTVADLAASAKTRSDWSVLVTVGVTDDHQILVLDLVRRKLDGGQLVPLIREIVARWGAVYVESTPYHTQLVSILRSEGLPIREIVADKDKVVRAEIAVAAAERGRVWLPGGVPWLQDFRSEICEFPDGKFDDQVDAFAHACQLGSLPVRVVRPRMREFRDEDERDRWLIGRG